MKVRFINNPAAQSVAAVQMALTPDAVGITVSASVNTGIFGSFGGNIGGAVDVHNNAERFLGGFMDIGYNGSLGIPKISLGITVDAHDSYSGNDSSVTSNSIPGGVLGNLGGESQRIQWRSWTYWWLFLLFRLIWK